MPHRAKRTFSVSAEVASYIDALVASGAYASANEVVWAGLQACGRATPLSIVGCGRRSFRFMTPWAQILVVLSLLLTSSPQSAIAMPSA
jgi:hypothetical protein